MSGVGAHHQNDIANGIVSTITCSACTIICAGPYLTGWQHFVKVESKETKRAIHGVEQTACVHCSINTKPEDWIDYTTVPYWELQE
eukprot:10888588-Ditylum_brightwellii.AAC.1